MNSALVIVGQIGAAFSIFQINLNINILKILVSNNIIRKET